MVRQPCCEKIGLKKGPWTAEEDKKLVDFILNNGQCCWKNVPTFSGLKRCGKSCRLRWTNYLRPDLKRGLLSNSEEKLLINLHAQLGNRWSKIASHLPGRTDNDIKNYWNTHIKKKLKKMGIDPVTHEPLPTKLPAPLLEDNHQEQTDDRTKEQAAGAAAASDVCMEAGNPKIDPLEEIVTPPNHFLQDSPIVSSSSSSSASSSSLDSKMWLGAAAGSDLCMEAGNPKEIVTPYDHYLQDPSISSSSTSSSSMDSKIWLNRDHEEYYDYCSDIILTGYNVWEDDFRGTFYLHHDSVAAASYDAVLMDVDEYWKYMYSSF